MSKVDRKLQKEALLTMKRGGREHWLKEPRLQSSEGLKDDSWSMFLKDRVMRTRDSPKNREDVQSRLRKWRVREKRRCSGSAQMHTKREAQREERYGRGHGSVI